MRGRSAAGSWMPLRGAVLALALLLIHSPGSSADSDSEAARFERAWQAASRGQRAEFERLRNGLTGYVLYPYLQYDDLLQRRATAPAVEMAAFLATHADWAFAAGLKTAWLRALGQQHRWRDLLDHAGDSTDAEIRCLKARARVALGLTGDLQSEAQDLWAIGKSQHDACDPVFDWLRSSGGITPELAWLRIRRAMEQRNARLTLYLGRFVPSQERVWVERWQQQDRAGYVHLDQAKSWTDGPHSRDITAFGLVHLARRDPDRAWLLFERLDGHLDWGPARRGELLADLALWSAVAGAPATPSRMRTVPESARSDRLLEWWARNGLATGNWPDVILAVSAMSPAARESERWRYWEARARLAQGDPEPAHAMLERLSTSATYYGFLAADLLQRPYAICPHDAAVDPAVLAAFRDGPVMRRILELERVGLSRWSRAEWQLMTRRATPAELRLAAALATEQGWPDRAIAALAGSGDQQWYDWRFPVTYAPLVAEHARRRELDVAWVMGLMRSESAMAADAVSPAGARGLMQVMPATASQLAERHSFAYRGNDQLLDAADNIRFGTTFLRDLMDRFGDNPVLVSGAYNAGPGAVRRWLESLPADDATVWIEVLPFHETRDYIPRVLAFATIYDWRLDQPVRRLTSRMPPLAPGAAPGRGEAAAVAEVACPTPLAATGSGF